MSICRKRFLGSYSSPIIGKNVCWGCFPLLVLIPRYKLKEKMPFETSLGSKSKERGRWGGGYIYTPSLSKQDSTSLTRASPMTRITSKTGRDGTEHHPIKAEVRPTVIEFSIKITQMCPEHCYLFVLPVYQCPGVQMPGPNCLLGHLFVAASFGARLS